ncbi:MAG: hypothetical protein RIB67_03305 [Miltoncostaeaceae bacterium]
MDTLGTQGATGDHAPDTLRRFILGMGRGYEVRLLEVVAAALLDGCARTLQVVCALERLVDEGTVIRLRDIPGKPTRYLIGVPGASGSGRV